MEQRKKRQVPTSRTHLSPADNDLFFVGRRTFYAYCHEIAEYLDAKKSETRKKIAHFEKVSQLLDVAVETLRDLNQEVTSG